MNTSFGARQRNPVHNAIVSITRRRALVAIVLLLAAIGLANCSDRTSSPLPTPAASGPDAIARNDTPAIMLNPASGYAGSYINVQGQGWLPSTVIHIRLADEQGRGPVLAIITADSQGQFSTGFLYPPSERWLQPGARTVIASTEDGGVEAVATFAIAPPAGVEQSLPAPTPADASPVGDATQATLTATQTTSLTHTLMPIIARTGMSATQTDLVVNIEPNTGGENTQVTIYGSGLAGNSKARIYLTEASHAHSPGEGRYLYIEVTSDANGAYNAQFTVPPAWPDGVVLSSGELFFVVTDLAQTVLATVPFTFLATPPLATPAPTPADLPAVQRNPVAEVEIDIEPERINLRGNGVIRVIVPTQGRPPESDDDDDNESGKNGTRTEPSEVVDWNNIEASSVRLGRRGDVLQGVGGAVAIRNEARRREHRFHFRARETGLSAEDDEACLSGVWFDNQGDAHTFFGCDAIRVRGSRDS